MLLVVTHPSCALHENGDLENQVNQVSVIVFQTSEKSGS